MALYTSYNVNTGATKTDKESFEDQISLLSPVDTPFSSMIKKMAINNSVHSWAEDELEDSDATPQIEGFLASSLTATSNAPVRRTTYTQILAEAVQVSDSVNATDLYGRKQAYAYQLKKKGLKLKKSVESAFLTNGATAIGGAGTARSLGGFESQVDPANVADTASTGVLTADDIFGMTLRLYEEGAKPSVVLVNPALMLAISKWQEAGTATTGATRVRMFDNLDTKLNVEVNTLIDPLGQTLKIIPDREMPADKVFIFNPENWAALMFRNFHTYETGKAGSLTEGVIEVELGLRHDNAKASAVITIA